MMPMENLEKILKETFYKPHARYKLKSPEKIERFIEIAAKLIAKAEKGELTKESWKTICKEENISQMQYYWILKTLRVKGLIIKYENRYVTPGPLVFANQNPNPQVTSQ